jgi:hypothetical protein
VEERKMSTGYSFRTRIITIKEHFESKNWRLEVQGDGSKLPVCDEKSIGWYIKLEGSWESMYVGLEKPDLAEGQAVTVSIVPTG